MAGAPKDPGTKIRSLALALADVDEGVACEGTPLEKRTLRTNKRAFLFLGARDAMWKAGDSLAEIKALATKNPHQWKAGSGGWVTLRFGDAKLPGDAQLARWIRESHGLIRASAKPKKR